MRILVLTPQPLVPLHDGLNLRIFHLFREVARRHDVWILFLAEGGVPKCPEVLATAGFAGLHGVPVRGRNGAPFRHCHDYSSEVEGAIRHFLQQTPVDVIVAASIYTVPYARPWIHRPLLLDLVDDMSLLVRRSLWRQPTWRGRLRTLRTWHFWQWYERQNLPAFPHIAVTSASDARQVTHYAPQAEVVVLPNGVDADVFHPWPERSEAPDIVFTGVMGFGPNEAAVVHFYSNIFPHIRRAIPEARFIVAGKEPTSALRRLVEGDHRVLLTGYVEDIRPYIGRAAVCVAPMISGSGIKNKILEAWAMARPVVATPMACGDLEGIPDKTHFVAHTPTAFADTVIRLLRDHPLGDRVGGRARQLVLERYQWAVAATRLSTLLERLAAAGHAPRVSPPAASPSPAGTLNPSRAT